MDAIPILRLGAGFDSSCSEELRHLFPTGPRHFAWPANLEKTDSLPLPFDRVSQDLARCNTASSRAFGQEWNTLCPIVQRLLLLKQGLEQLQHLEESRQESQELSAGNVVQRLHQLNDLAFDALDAACKRATVIVAASSGDRKLVDKVEILFEAEELGLHPAALSVFKEHRKTEFTPRYRSSTSNSQAEGKFPSRRGRGFWSWTRSVQESVRSAFQGRRRHLEARFEWPR